MGFLEVLNPAKNVFDDQSFAKAINGVRNDGSLGENNGYAVIRIKPNPLKNQFGSDFPSIVGVIQDKLAFNIVAEWERTGGIGGIAPNIELVRNLSNFGGTAGGLFGGPLRAAGFSNTGATFASRKVYHQSGYLEINPEIMVVDWDGDASPINTAILLAMYCLPFDADVNKQIQSFVNKIKSVGSGLLKSGTKSLIKGIGRGLSMVNEGVKDVGNATNLSLPIDGLTNDQIKNVTASLSEAAVSFANTSKVIFEDLDDLITLRKAPPPVQVKIGEYFEHKDMVLEQVNFEFSKEVTETGPLFMKANLRLSSRKIVNNIDKIGLTRTKIHTHKRASIIESRTARTSSPFNAIGETFNAF